MSGEQFIRTEREKEAPTPLTIFRMLDSVILN